MSQWSYILCRMELLRSCQGHPSRTTNKWETRQLKNNPFLVLFIFSCHCSLPVCPPPSILYLWATLGPNIIITHFNPEISGILLNSDRMLIIFLYQYMHVDRSYFLIRLEISENRSLFVYKLYGNQNLYNFEFCLIKNQYALQLNTEIPNI